MPLYLYLHLFAIAYPLAQSFEKRLQYAKKWKALFPGIIITAIFFIVWDEVFTTLGVWGFNPEYLIGAYIFSLPIEEWLFFVTIPFASVFIYECVLYFIPSKIPQPVSRKIVLIVGLALLFISAFHSDQLYTFWAFLFTGILLLVHYFLSKPYLGDFIVAYLIHLLPFFIVNGVLTGSWIEGQVVWYNDDENLGIRLWTIPIEDSIYGMLLLLMNISFYEFFKTRFGLNTFSHK